ncbi:MAG: hypothetical protein QM500_17780 [Methylococcales bacterium]
MHITYDDYQDLKKDIKTVVDDLHMIEVLHTSSAKRDDLATMQTILKTVNENRSNSDAWFKDNNRARILPYTGRSFTYLEDKGLSENDIKSALYGIRTDLLNEHKNRHGYHQENDQYAYLRSLSSPAVIEHFKTGAQKVVVDAFQSGGTVGHWNKAMTELDDMLSMAYSLKASYSSTFIKEVKHQVGQCITNNEEQMARLKSVGFGLVVDTEAFNDEVSVNLNQYHEHTKAIGDNLSKQNNQVKFR